MAQDRAYVRAVRPNAISAGGVVDDAPNIWPNYWHVEDLTKIKHALIDDVTSAYAENARLLRSKGQGLKVLVGFSALDVLLVGSLGISGGGGGGGGGDSSGGGDEDSSSGWLNVCSRSVPGFRVIRLCG